MLPFLPVAAAFVLVFYGLRPFSRVRNVEKLRPIAESAVSASGLDVNLILAVVTKESGGDPSARSSVNALGLMQLRIAAATDAAARLGIAPPTETDLLDPILNLKLGSMYLKILSDRYGGAIDVALAGYLKGPEWVNRVGGIDGVRRILKQPGDVATYVNRILELAEKLKARKNA
ncbi:MAG: lytic transglycosylase domain-containing protein [Planctomycetota bacterium]